MNYFFKADDSIRYLHNELTLLMIAAGIGAFRLLFETAAPTFSGKIFWSELEYNGGILTPVLSLIFVLRFTGKDKFIHPKYILLLFIVTINFGSLNIEILGQNYFNKPAIGNTLMYFDHAALGKRFAGLFFVLIKEKFHEDLSVYFCEGSIHHMLTVFKELYFRLHFGLVKQIVTLFEVCP